MREKDDKTHSLDKEIKRNIDFLKKVLKTYKKTTLDINQFIAGCENDTKVGTNQDVLRDACPRTDNIKTKDGLMNNDAAKDKKHQINTNQDILRDACLRTANIKTKDGLMNHNAAKEILFAWCLIYCEGVLRRKSRDDYLKDKAFLASHDAVMDAFKYLRDDINLHFQNNPNDRFKGTKGKGIRAYLGTVMENAYKKQRAGKYTRVRVDETDKKDFKEKVPPKLIDLVEISESEAEYVIKKDKLDVIYLNEYKHIEKFQSRLEPRYKTIIIREEIIHKTSSGIKKRYKYFRPEWQSRTKAMELTNRDNEIYTDAEVNEYVINSTYENAKRFMAKDILDSVIEYMSSHKLLSDLELEFLDRIANNNEKQGEIKKDWINRGIKIKGNTIGNFKTSLLDKIRKELCSNTLWQDLLSDFEA